MLIRWPHLADNIGSRFCTSLRPNRTFSIETQLLPQPSKLHYTNWQGLRILEYTIFLRMTDVVNYCVVTHRFLIVAEWGFKKIAGSFCACSYKDACKYQRSPFARLLGPAETKTICGAV